MQALEDLLRLTMQDPTCVTAWEAQATAFWKLGKISAAMQSCRKAEKVLDVKSSTRTRVSQLMDDIAISAASAGNLDGFDGRQLEVRSSLP